MKYFQLCLFVLLSYASVYSQESETLSEDWFVSGTFSYVNSSNTNFSQQILVEGVSRFEILNSTSRFSFFPTIGKKLSHHWLGGFNFGFQTSTSKSEIVIIQNPFPNPLPTNPMFNETSFSTYSFGIFGRYIFNPDGKFKVFLTPSVNYGVIGGDREGNSLTISVSPGLSYRLSERFRLLTQITGLSYNTGDINGIDFSDFSADFSLSNFRFGADILF